jgi:hypothetical protein
MICQAVRVLCRLTTWVLALPHQSHEAPLSDWSVEGEPRDLCFSAGPHRTVDQRAS